MKGVVLAGGEGRRLRPLTKSRPKPLLPVAGRPCIEFVLKSLVRSGVTDVVITAGFLAEAIPATIGDGAQYGASVSYGFEDEPAGTAGSVKRVAESLDDTFVVAMGDVLVDLDVRPLIEFHRQRKSKVTIALTEVDDPTEYGIVGLAGDGRIERFKEKPTAEEAFSRLVNAGIYVIEPDVLDLIPDHEPFDFSKNVFPLALAKGLPLYGRKMEGVWVDIGRPQDLIRANVEVVRREGTRCRLPGVKPFGPAIVKEGLTLDEGAEIDGPCYLGAGVAIREGATIDSSALLDGSSVGRSATVRRSVVMERCHLGEEAQVVDSVLSRDCTVESGVHLASCVLGEGVTVRADSRLEGVSIPPL